MAYSAQKQRFAAVGTTIMVAAVAATLAATVSCSKDDVETRRAEQPQRPPQQGAAITLRADTAWAGTDIFNPE